MNKIKSPLKHEEGNALAHNPYVSEEAYHEANPENNVKEVEEKEVVDLAAEETNNDPGFRILNTEDQISKKLMDEDDNAVSLKTKSYDDDFEFGTKVTPNQPKESKTTEEFYQDEEEYQKPFAKPKLSQDDNGNWLVNGVIPDSSGDKLESAMMPYVKSNKYNPEELDKIRELSLIHI